jgi:type IX secretion system PorP/SprF family membrane protein
MKKLILPFCLLVLGATGLFAQQENHYTQFMYNKLLLNPAFAGARRIPSVLGLYRQQWVGFNGKPQSYLLAFDIPFNQNRVGLGFNLANQQAGIIKNQFAQMSVSYGIVQTEKSSLRLGMGGVVRRFLVDASNPNVVIDQANDEALINADTDRQYYGNMGAGVYFDHENFYAGFSIPNIFRNYFGLNQARNLVNIAREQRHFYLNVGGIVKITEGVELKPSVMAKYVKNAPFSLDLSLNAFIKRKFGVGAAYRTGQTGGDSIDGLLFFQATDKLGFGVAYDYPVSGLLGHTAGSIEALIRYDLFSSLSGIDKQIKSGTNRLSNPRYFF